MEQEIILKSIETLGYPITISLLSGLIFWTLIKWILARFEENYKNGRADFKEIAEKFERISLMFNETVKDVSEQNADNVRKYAEFQQKVLAGLDKLNNDHARILNMVRDKERPKNK